MPNEPLSDLEIVYAKRGARNSAIISGILSKTANLEKLEDISKIIDLLVGQADNLTQMQMHTALNHLKMNEYKALIPDEEIDELQKQIFAAGLAAQKIRSQLIYRKNSDEKAKLPAISQLFGQRFVMDSFILSQLVYGSIKYNGKPVKRMMPTGLDVMAALGNDLAARMLKGEMEKYPYAANMMVCQDYINSFPQEKWNETIYSRWLNILRDVDQQLYDHQYFPQVMKTKAWRQKQLQTQLASWSQLRHDTILYAKQSFTAGIECFYPKGYVEPYPNVYRKIGELATSLASVIKESKVDEEFKNIYGNFWLEFAKIQNKLVILSEKELRGEPFSKDEESFIKKTIDKRGIGSGPPRYDGWYSKLFLGDHIEKWEPEIVDVHTNPDQNGFSECLEVGTGDVNFIIAAIDNGKDITAYVGPTYSYYEFIQNLNGNNKRLTDKTWAKKIQTGKAPARPDWTRSFQADKKKRVL